MGVLAVEIGNPGLLRPLAFLVGAEMQARLHFRTDEERKRAEKTGISDLDRKYTHAELASKDCVFIATGVTEGLMLNGVRRGPDYVATESLVLSSVTGSRRIVETRRPL